ncbi:hypothetical protein [Pseudoalteromonas sp. 3-MNA-CIBAN-0064]|uniref:hypothetical protein n=1 Tax=Pseudoalteromonas sp. 3-MNA-CIBAN-0064 TaxID=3140420 RepID=UPI00332E2CB8
MSSIKRTLELNTDETAALISALTASKVKHQTDIELFQKSLDIALDKAQVPHPFLEWSITYANERLCVVESLIQQITNFPAEFKA